MQILTKTSKDKYEFFSFLRGIKNEDKKYDKRLTSQRIDKIAPTNC